MPPVESCRGTSPIQAAKSRPERNALGSVTVAVMTFLTSWNEFIMANTYLASDELRTLPFSILRFQDLYSGDYAAQFACMVIVAVPALALYLWSSRHVMAGATTGAIKE